MFIRTVVKYIHFSYKVKNVILFSWVKHRITTVVYIKILSIKKAKRSHFMLI